MTTKKYENYLNGLFDSMNIDALEDNLVYLEMQSNRNPNPDLRAVYGHLYDVCEDLVQMYYMLY